MTIVDRAKAKTYLKIDSSDTSQDALVDIFISAADSFMKKLLWPIENAGTVQTTDYVSSRDITTDWKYQYVRLQGINVFAVDTVDWESLWTKDTDYWILPPNSRKIKALDILGKVTDLSNSSIPIVYKCWWTVADMPWDIVMATLKVIGGLYAEDKGQLVQSYKVGDVSVTFADNWNPEAMQKSVTSFRSMVSQYLTFTL